MTEATADPQQALQTQADSLQDAGRHQEAIALYDQALALSPNIADLHYNKGLSLVALRLFGDALTAFEAAQRLDPNWAEAHYNYGTMLERDNRLTEALAAFDRAVRLTPSMAAAWRNRAGVLAALDRHEDALASIERARALGPLNARAELNRGGILVALQRFAEAQTALELTLRLDPDNAVARGLLLSATVRNCDLKRSSALRQQVLYDVAARKASLAPITLLTISDDLALQKIGAEDYAKTTLAENAAIAPAPRPPAYAHDRLRIAYMSSDLTRDHPVGAHIAGLLERHDRTKFEVIALALTAPDDSAVGRRIAKACDAVHVVRDSGDTQAAALIRSLKADILVDLNGPTQHWRPGILNRRPAPVQVAYLGYAGTTGAIDADYLIADSIVLPPGTEPHITEQIVRLPNCFWPADPAEDLPAPPSRAALGLPESGFVFCAFNAHRKINAEMFGVWMRLLKATPGSVLWLRAVQPDVQRQLLSEAAERGIAPERLVWADFATTNTDHLARHAQADLFLDTFPYGAHATAAAALAAGVPVLTRRGESFASRVAASFLHTLELEDLITDGVAAYEAAALALVADPARLAALRAKLIAARSGNPFFDGALFARHIEAAYTRMHAIARAGEPPRPITVQA